jgi:hypothetical protein
MTKLIIAAFISLFTCTYLNGQEKGRMETDRPDQTESPYLTKHHFVQVRLVLIMKRHKGLRPLFIQQLYGNMAFQRNLSCGLSLN